MAVLRGPCYKDIMGGFFLRPDFRQIRQTFENFWGRVAVLRGLCNLNKIEGIFYESRNRQNGQTFFIFLEGVSFSGVFVTYIRWRVFFS